MTSLKNMTDGANRPPFVGHRTFEADDRDIFFGRERECAELTSVLSQTPIVVVHGPSGSGKSSLLRTALAPALADGAEVLAPAHVTGKAAFPHAALPDHNPHTLAVLAAWSPAESRSVLAQLSLTDFLTQRVQATKWSRPRSLVVAVIDQLEEIFADAWQERHRDNFFEDLASAVRVAPSLRVVLAIRSDALPGLAGYQKILRINRESAVAVGPLSRDAALEAIRRPLERAGLRIGEGVADDLVTDLSSSPLDDGTAPEAQEIQPVQLQVACCGLYRAIRTHASLITRDFLDLHELADEELAGFCREMLTETALTYEVTLAALIGWLKRAFITPQGTRAYVADTAPGTTGMPYGVIRGLLSRHLLTTTNSGPRRFALANDRLLPVVRGLASPARAQPSSDTSAQGHLRIAVMLIADGELTLAQSHIWHALKTTEWDLRLEADARSLLGDIAFERGELDRAEEQYYQAAEVSERLQDRQSAGRLLGATGRIHARQGRYTAALEDLQAAVSRMPGELALQTELGKVLWLVGQPVAATAVFGSVLNTEPRFAEALAGRGQVRAEHGSASSALDDLQALQRLRPSMVRQPEVRSALALALARTGRPESAMREADAALASAPDNGPIFLRAARVASASGVPERATALLRRAEEARDPALSSEQRNEAQRLLKSVSGSAG